MIPNNEEIFRRVYQLGLNIFYLSGYKFSPYFFGEAESHKRLDELIDSCNNEMGIVIIEDGGLFEYTDIDREKLSNVSESNLELWEKKIAGIMTQVRSNQCYQNLLRAYKESNY